MESGRKHWVIQMKIRLHLAYKNLSFNSQSSLTAAHMLLITISQTQVYIFGEVHPGLHPTGSDGYNFTNETLSFE